MFYFYLNVFCGKFRYYFMMLYFALREFLRTFATRIYKLIIKIMRKAVQGTGPCLVLLSLIILGSLRAPFFMDIAT